MRRGATVYKSGIGWKSSWSAPQIGMDDAANFFLLQSGKIDDNGMVLNGWLARIHHDDVGQTLLHLDP